MIQDAALPQGLAPPRQVSSRRGVLYQAARWTPDTLERLAEILAPRSGAPRTPIDPGTWLDAWAATVDAFLDPDSPERRDLNEVLVRFTGLSPEGLQAGLEAVLGGADGEQARLLLQRADEPERVGELVLVVLAGNLPGLAVQPLLPALARGRAVLLKPPSAEPLFTPAFVRALTERCPALGHRVAAASWPGGDSALEQPLLERAETVIAYGEQETIASLEERAPGRVLDYGPKISLAAVGEDARPEEAAPGLARDVALFDQRGCLSVQAVYTAGDPTSLGRSLGRALKTLAERWPPGRAGTQEAVGVHQLRTEARMRGLWVADTEPAVGTVLVEPLPRLRPSPGRRTIRVHPLDDLRELPRILAPWKGRLQGAALAGERARELEPALRELGVTRCALPGELQTPDQRWQNGGRDLIGVL